jgi:hypothetical protein
MKMPALLALATLGNATQRDMILFVLQCQGRHFNATKLPKVSITNSANGNAALRSATPSLHLLQT